jgi:hypothetical protein
METQGNEPSNTEPSGGEVGLLDSATVTDDSAAQPDTQNVVIAHKAEEPSTDEEPLERPDFWPENFWKKDTSEPDLEGIAKSWGDLRKQISQGKHKAPADGKYDTAAFGSIPEDDPLRSHVMGWAQKYGLSQGALDDLVGEVVKMGSGNVEAQVKSLQQEKAALGPNADAVVKGMVDWASGLVRKGIWGKDDFEEFKVMGGTANGIKALMKLRESYEGTRIPTNSLPPSGAPSKDELYQMVADPKYKTDPAFRQKVERMFASSFQ